MFAKYLRRAEGDGTPALGRSLGRDRVWPTWALGLLLSLAVLLIYSNTLNSPFTYDDYGDLLEQTTIRHLWPLRDVFYMKGMGFMTRPVVNLSFALNYASGGIRPFPFHLTNLLIHLCASLVFLGVVRRSLALPLFQGRFKEHLSTLALVTAALWALHPLLTESVSYITQRYESLMALFVLWTFYAVLRSLESPHPLRWHGLAVLGCLLSLGSKEVAVSLPVLVLLFDWIFLAGSFRGAWRERRLLYLGMALTWIPFLYIQLHAIPRPFAASSYTTPWWRYSLNQPRVILHYLRLAVWPHPLVFDYFWKAEENWKPLLPGLVALGLLMVCTIWSLFRSPKLAFLPIFFLAILAPTSSVMPILDLAVEHRMYLPLAPVIVALVLGGYALLTWFRVRFPRHGLMARPFLVAAMAGIFACLGILTFLRNEDYRDPVDLWRSVTEAVPRNPRGHNNYGFQLAETGHMKEALDEYAKAVALAPQMGLFRSNYGLTLAKAGRYQEALEQLRTAVRLEPYSVKYLNNLGLALLMKGSYDSAATCFETAVQINPKEEISYGGLASVYQAKGDYAKALGFVQQAIGLNPYFAGFQEHRAQLLLSLGDLTGARAAFLEAIRLQPSAEKISDLAWSLHTRALDPEALGALRQALHMKPGHVRSEIRMAWILATASDASLRNGPEAIRLAEEVLRSQRPIRSPEMLDLLAVSLAEAGRFPEAKSVIQEALAQSKDHKEVWVSALRNHQALFEKNEPFHEATESKPGSIAQQMGPQIAPTAPESVKGKP